MGKFYSSILMIVPMLFWSSAIGQNNSKWNNTFYSERGIVESIGQFEKQFEDYRTELKYAYDGGAEDYLFLDGKVVIRFNDRSLYQKSESEKAARAERKKSPFESLEEWQEFERAGNRVVIEHEDITIRWDNANPNATIEPIEKTTFFKSYSWYENGKMVNRNQVSCFRGIVYKNLYPNIDLRYTLHPDGGMKYDLIAHPGADLSQVSFTYSHPVTLAHDGTLEVKTDHGSILESVPVCYYSDNAGNTFVAGFTVDGNTVSFNVDNHDATKELIIDPWIQTPAFPSNWDCVWECETDAAGNSYLIGGVMPLELHKYNAAGALQWTYNTPYDTTSWLGTFATDDAGFSYVTQGSTAEILCVNTAGALVWSNNSPGGLFTSTEFWNIAFNCDQTRLVVGGTGGSIPPLPYIYDIDMASGNVLSSIQVHGSSIAGIPPNTQEVRAITATENNKYYYLSHDTIGYVNDDLTLCPGSGGQPFHVENGGYDFGYKCENWRYNNTGMEAIAYYNGFIYTHRGDQIDKREFSTANIIASAPIPGGQYNNVFLGGNVVENSGIIIDECGNIFVGATNGVVQFDENLNQLATFATSFVVYDVDITSTGDLIAAGSTGDSGSGSRSGSIQSFNAGACAQLATVCCNPSVCDPGTLCDTDPPVTLQPETPGGTWSISPATGGFNTGTGEFDPSAAGSGTFMVYYTLACGTDSVEITVNTCTALSVCVEANGDLTVTGGTGPYDWDVFDPGTTINITNATECTACGGTWSFGQCFNPFPVPITSCTTAPGYVNFATGTTVTPPPSNDIQVTDGNGTVLQFDPATLPPCSATCDPTITQVGPYCETDPSVLLSAVDPGGTWSATCGACIDAAGNFDPATAGAGSHTITYDLPCGSSDNITIDVNAPDDASFSYSAGSFCLTDPDPTATITGLTGGTFTIDNGGTINAADGTIDIAASGTGTYTVTYTTSGPCPNSETFSVTLTSGADATISAAGPFCENDPAVLLTAVDPGGTWTASCGACIDAAGNFDPAAAGAGSHTVTYTISGSCGDTDDETIVVNPTDDASFSYSAASFCLTDPDPVATITGLAGGTFTIDNGGTINAADGTIDIAASGAGSYTVTYTTNGPCPNSETFSVTLTSGADATITAAGPFCENDPAVLLTAVDPGGTWTASCGACIDAAGNFDPATAGAGSHTITYTISGSCGDTDDETIVVNAADDASFSYAGATYCTIDPDPAATITGTTGGTFTIDNGGTINAANGTIDLDASGSGSYTVTYTTSGPCPDFQTFSVTISSAFDATITAAGPFCANDPSVLLTTADPGGTWSATCGACIDAAGNFDPSTAGAGTHTITYTIPGSCGDTDDLVITVDPADDASFSYAVNAWCLLDPDPVPTISGTTGGTFTIDNGGIINASTGEIDLNTTGAGAYTVTYTTSGPCPDSQTFSLTINDALDATIANAGPYCETDPQGTLSAANSGGTWSGVGITDAATGVFDPSNAGPGTWEVIYTIPGACGDSDTIFIEVFPAPFVDAGNDTTLTEGGTIELNGTSSATGFTWTGPGSFLAFVEDPVINPAALSNAGTYYLTVSDGNGCIGTDSVEVIIIDVDMDIWIPNIFSPNGDGNNDFFYVRGDGLNEFNLKIFNRWGEMIFESFDQAVPWNGTHNEKPVDSGVYVYMVTYLDAAGEEQVISGNITVVQY